MNKVVTYLESKEIVFHAAVALIILYIPHAGHLFMEIEHIDMTIYGFTIMNWIYGICLAAVIEVLILVFIINGYQRAGKAYALVSFFINALYYDYWFITLQEPTILNIKWTATSLLICFMHSLAIWQLSDLFRRVRADKEKVIEHWCSECDMGPFPSKRSLDGHKARHLAMLTFHIKLIRCPDYFRISRNAKSVRIIICFRLRLFFKNVSIWVLEIPISSHF